MFHCLSTDAIETVVYSCVLKEASQWLHSIDSIVCSMGSKLEIRPFTGWTATTVRIFIFLGGIESYSILSCNCDCLLKGASVFLLQIILPVTRTFKMLPECTVSDVCCVLEQHQLIN